MAKEFYGFFDSVVGDEREYDAAQFSHVLKALARNGVSSHTENSLRVTAEGASMATVVGAGGCLVNGYLYVLSEDGGDPMRMEHPPSAASDRYDRVVVRLELFGDVRKISLKLLTGTPAASPQPPTLTRTESVYEMALAKVRVRAAAESIEAADVEDERGDEAVCGEAVPVWLNKQALDKRYAGHDVATTQTDGLMSAADKVDLAGKASTANYTAKFLGAGWSAGVPHVQTVAVEGMLVTDSPFVDVDMSGATTGAEGTALSDAWTLVGRVEARAASITAYCYDDAPAVDIPLILKVVR